MRGRRKVVHGEQATLPIFGKQRRRGVGEPAADRPHPCRFSGVALDRRFPNRGDLQARQRALDAKPPRRCHDLEDVRRHAAGQRTALNSLVAVDQVQRPQRRDNAAVL